MRRRHNRTRRATAVDASSATPVFDLLFLLTIAFLGVGVFQAAGLRVDVGVSTLRAHTSEASDMADRQSRHLAALEPIRDRLRRQIERLKNAPHTLPTPNQSMIDATHRELAMTQARLVTAQAAVDNLRTEVATLNAEQEPIPVAVIDRLNEVEKLEEQRRSWQDRVAQAEAEAVQADEDLPKLTKARVVRTDYQPEKEKFVLLTGGRIYAFPEDFNLTKEVLATTANLKGPGQTLKDAIAPASTLMKQVAAADFRQKGRVALLVRPDSFSTFRVLRDKLVSQKIDYGWLPWPVDFIRFSSGGGQQMQSHGSR